MATIYELVTTALGTLSPAVPFAMDEMVGNLPDTFITYFMVSGVPEQHADNTEKSRAYRVQVNIMNRSGLVGLPDVDTAMIAAGFRRGPERELVKDNQTSHYGLAKDYTYLMNE